MPPLGEGEHNSGDQFSLYFGPRLSPTPSRQPLFETSDLYKLEEKTEMAFKVAVAGSSVAFVSPSAKAVDVKAVFVGFVNLRRSSINVQTVQHNLHWTLAESKQKGGFVNGLF